MAAEPLIRKGYPFDGKKRYAVDGKKKKTQNKQNN